MLPELNEKLGSLTKSLDILYVLEGLKPVSRIFINDMEILSFLEKNKLRYSISDFKVMLHTDYSRNYTDKGIRLKCQNFPYCNKENPEHAQEPPHSPFHQSIATKRSSDWWFLTDSGMGSQALYVSKHKNLADKAKFFEGRNEHYNFGKLLGYPECCCHFFEKNNKIKKSTYDLTVITARESEGFLYSWLNNNCLRGFDISLISHFPCHFNCQQTSNIALKNLAIIEKYNMDVANYFKRALRTVVIYSEGIGVFSLPEIKIVGNLIEYNPNKIISSSKNEFHELLSRHHFIKVFKKNLFHVEEIEINDARSFIGVFV